MLRALADGKVRWGFWPPGSCPDRGNKGIWLDGVGNQAIQDDRSDSGTMESVSENGDMRFPDELKTDEDIEETERLEPEEDDEQEATGELRGFFAALEVESDYSSDIVQDSEEEKMKT